MRDTKFPSRLAEIATEGAGLLVAVPLWAWWAVWKGGYPPAVFLAGIGYLALAAIALHLFGRRSRLEGAGAWALAALAALSAWTVTSLLWGDDRGAGEVASARQILLFGSFALPVLWPPTARALVAALAAVPFIALCGAVSALGAMLGDPRTLLDGRLADPTGYTNASAALMAIGTLIALALASRSELAVALRAALLGSAGALLGTFVLTQSRGGLAALVLVTLLALVLLPGWLRLLVPLAIVAISIGVVLDPLLEVRRAAVNGGDLAGAVRTATRALTFTAIALVGIGVIYCKADARVRIGARTARRISATLATGIAASMLIVVIALLASAPDLGGWVSDRVDDFKTPDYERLESEPTRFTGDLGSNRYDYWRVSVDVFADRPLTGSGAGNFIAPFLERRHADKSTLYSHSIWLGALAELGGIGFLALLTFACALALALLRAARRQPSQRWIVATASLPLAYLLIHGAFDWISVFPAISVPALALAGAAVGVRPPLPEGRGDRLQPAGPSPADVQGSGWVAAMVTVTLVVATIAAAPLLVAARLADRGATTWQEHPAAAIGDLEDAASLDPLAAAPYVRLGVVAIELERPALAAKAFRSALQRDRSAWYPEFQLGLLAAAAADRRRALEDLETALQRNPREPEVRRALRLVRSGRPVDPRMMQRRILSQADG